MEHLSLEQLFSLKSRDSRGFRHSLLTIPGSPFLQVLQLILFVILVKLPFTYHRPANEVPYTAVHILPPRYHLSHHIAPSNDPSASEDFLLRDPDHPENPVERIPISNSCGFTNLKTLKGPTIRIYEVLDVEMQLFSNNLARLGLIGQIMVRPMDCQRITPLIDENQSPDDPFVPHLIWVMVCKEQETMLRRIRINNRDIKKTNDLKRLRSKRVVYAYYFVFAMFVGFLRLASSFFHISWFEFSRMQTIGTTSTLP
ncbi:hypothetical protein BYT27DRAFT_7191584 [Phlegmacium glaucopus]|nr:hypothetical protein BYT27DRAFT_7191584 [Phlegmacium glaucopus]